MVEAAQDFTRHAIVKRHEKKREKKQRELAEQQAERRLAKLQNKDPTPEAIAEALAQEEMMTIHHNHEIATKLGDDLVDFGE